MPNTTKPGTKLDYEQAIQGAYNDVNSTLGVDGFLTGKIGRKVELGISSETITGVITGVDNVETYSFSENGTTLYILKIIYTDTTRSQMVSAERVG